MYLPKDRGRFIDRVETVRNYSYKHIRGKDTQRAKWFIRILCMMPRANFHPIALARLAKKQIENLQETANSPGYNAGIELIPFENLLEMLMTHLQKKICLLYTSPSPRDRTRSRMPSSA